jgi:beta-glucosidase
MNTRFLWFILPVALISHLSAILVATTASVHAEESRPLYLDPSQPVERRVEDLLSRLTLEEKISLLHADSKFTTAPIPRLNIPLRWMSDGPHGVREDIGPDTWRPAGRTDDFATCMPSGIALAATWNPEIAYAEGVAIGEEALARGKHIMLGPAVNIMRTPLCGRNFEYFGEDPFLAARITVGYIRGEQSRDVASCIKHFAANNQEWQRNSINVEMDERALREIYLSAFKAAVQEAGVWAVMGAYNKLRGDFCCQDDYLLKTILKGEWDFRGLVVSDWGAVHDTRGAALGGLDLEMGTDKPYDEFFFARPLRESVQKGEVPMSVIDDKVRRNLRVMIATHVFDGRPAGSLNTKEHQATARRVAEEAMVLLKNEGGTLPVDLSKIKSIAVIGENAVRLQAHGGASSEIKAFYEVTPLDGILHRVGDRVNVTFSEGCRKQGDAGLVERVVTAAKQADVAIVVGGLNHDPGFDCEGRDRRDMELPYGQDELIQRVVEANPRTIVVLVGGSPMEMGPWLERVPAVLLAWYGGMECGNALARILFGDVNPSGKLPCTFPKRLADSPAHALNAYPGTNGVVRYEEGLLVGYRWFDTKNIEPLFPFGYGLSYTRFEYSNLKLVEGALHSQAVGVPPGRDRAAPPSEDEARPAVAPYPHAIGNTATLVTVQFDVTNTGDREGGEVTQLYVHDAQPGLPRPARELKGFRKVFLKPGEKRTVSIPLGRSAFAFYDPQKSGWLAEKGDFAILVGGSSRDIRLKGSFVLAQTTLEK